MRRLLTSLVLLLFAGSAVADDYEVSVTRKGSNLYKVDLKQIIVKTRYCYEYVFYENALLRMSGYSGDIIFMDSGGKCDVEADYGTIGQKAGKYIVAIYHEEDDWYRVYGTALFIKTDGCSAISFGEDAILTLNAAGSGMLKIDGWDCMVDGVYQRLNL